MNHQPRPLSPSIPGFPTVKMSEDVDLLSSWANDGAASVFASCFGLSQHQGIPQSHTASFQANVDETIAALTSKTFMGSVDTPWRYMGEFGAEKGRKEDVSCSHSQLCAEGNTLSRSNHPLSTSQSSISSSDSQTGPFPGESPSPAPAGPTWTKPLLWQRRLSKYYPSLEGQSHGQPQQQLYGPADDLAPSPLASCVRDNCIDGNAPKSSSGRKQVTSPMTAIPEPTSVGGIKQPWKGRKGAAHSGNDWTKVSSPARRRRTEGKASTKSATNKPYSSQGGASASKMASSVAAKAPRATHGKGEKYHTAKRTEGKLVHVQLREGNETRYSCPCNGCDKHFSTSGHARRHSRIHSKLEPFSCPHIGCLATFTRRDNCTHHQRVRHNCSLRAGRLPEAR